MVRTRTIFGVLYSKSKFKSGFRKMKTAKKFAQDKANKTGNPAQIEMAKFKGKEIRRVAKRTIVKPK